MIKGQTTMLALIMVFMGIIAFVALIPAMTEVINAQLPIMDDMTSTLVSLFIPFIALSLIYSIWAYVIPHREEGY